MNKPCDQNVTMFKNYNDLFNKLKRIMKITYFKTAIEENELNTKKTWTILRQAIGKLNDKSNYPNSFTINNTQITDKLQIAESFNKYFAKIGIQTSHSVPKVNAGFQQFMPIPQTHSMFLEPVY